MSLRSSIGDSINTFSSNRSSECSSNIPVLDEDPGDTSELIGLVPLTASASLPREYMHLEKIKTVGLFNGIAIVIGLEIGSGIFVSPGSVNYNAGSIGASLLVWLSAGLLAWTGASSYAELGTAIPLNGGAYAYLNHTFGPLPAYLFSWSAITALRPGSAAIISLTFANYLNRIIFGDVAKGIQPPWWADKLMAMLALCVVAGLQSIGPRWGPTLNSVLTSLKLAAMLSIVIIGIVWSCRGMGAGNFDSSLFEGSSTNLGLYALALYSGLWAYDGWDSITYVTAEMKNPRRDLARVIHISQGAVILVYLGANLAYYSVLPSEIIKHSSSVAVVR